MTAVADARPAPGVWHTFKEKSRFVWQQGRIALQAVTVLFFRALGLIFPNFSIRLEAAWGHVTTVWARLRGAIRVNRLERECGQLREEKQKLEERVQAVIVDQRVISSANDDLKRQQELLEATRDQARGERDRVLRENVHLKGRVEELEALYKEASSKSEKLENESQKALAEVVSLHWQLQQARGDEETALQRKKAVEECREIQRTLRNLVAKEGEDPELAYEKRLETRLQGIQQELQEHAEHLEADSKEMEEAAAAVLVKRDADLAKQTSELVKDFSEAILLYRKLMQVGGNHVRV
ncbi:MAG: hypothetical protein KGJ02_01855 [Verrucomicrobiota bacterium]|nr:hypothetical protein [Verrucomicrobiota bacterium]